MKYEECKEGMWVMARLPNNLAYPARIQAMPDLESGTPYLRFGSEGRSQAKRWWGDTGRAAVKFEDLLYPLEPEQFGDHHITVTKAYQVGCRLMNNLLERIKLCDELTRHKLPLPAYSRASMQRLFENENKLDELLGEVIADLLKGQGNGE